MIHPEFKNTVLLLGAGASIEWVKDGEISTQNLTRYLFEQIESKEWLDILANSIDKDIQEDLIKEYNKMVVTVLRDAEAKYNGKFNFETIIAIVDLLGTTSQTEDESYYFPNLIKHIYAHEWTSKFEDSNIRPILKIFPLLLRYLLVRRSFCLCDNRHFASDEREFLGNQTKLFLESIKQKVTIVSLNYDVFFQDIVEKLGYSNGFDNDLNNLVIGKLVNSEKKILYPHGSICLANNLSDDQNPIVTTWERNSDKLIRSIKFNIQNLYRDNINQGEHNNGLLYAQSIISGVNKQEVSKISPFSDYYFASVHALSQSNSLLIIVGYSFSDDHFNSLINYFLLLDGNKILVIDKFPGNSNELKRLSSEYYPENESDCAMRNFIDWLDKDFKEFQDSRVYCNFISKHFPIPLPDFTYIDNQPALIGEKILYFGGGYYAFLKYKEEIFRLI